MQAKRTTEAGADNQDIELQVVGVDSVIASASTILSKVGLEDALRFWLLADRAHDEILWEFLGFRLTWNISEGSSMLHFLRAPPGCSLTYVATMPEPLDIPVDRAAGQTEYPAGKDRASLILMG